MKFKSNAQRKAVMAKYRRGDKIWITYNTSSTPEPAIFLKMSGNAAIIKRVGVINKQGYSISRPQGVGIKLISKRYHNIK